VFDRIVGSMRALVIWAALALASPAMAGEIRPWDQGAFAEARDADLPIVIHVTAPWCPTCRAQHPTVEALVATSEHADLTVFEVDFDSQKDVLREFGVRQQSTLIAFKGVLEVARSVGETRPDRISALFDATL
jgi:thioredoxin 1